ncbi:MAG: MFS transporter [Gammaproteobacteria bacterium]|nr:MFS transporter [Gammaproteobacteria bacterium]
MKKPTLGFWQIWNMCFGFMGIQFGFALQNANVSRIFQSLGASVDELPLLWLAAPVTGLIVQPIIGYWSDRTWNRLGRRRPYFLYGALLASAALVVMPNSPTLWVAAGMLWILDASINMSMEPFRALVGDMLPNKQRALGYAMQSWFIGVGAIVASALPWMLTNWFDVSNMAEAGSIPESVRWSFYLGAFAFIGAVGWTILRTREYPPEALKSFEDAPESTPLADDGQGESGMLRTISRDLLAMPRVMRQLAVVQFLTWFALFAMWIYTTPGVTAHHYGASDASTAAYNDGADWVGVLFAVYNGVAALAALLLTPLASRLGRRGAHMLCLSLGGAGLVSFVFIDDPRWLILPMIGVGFAWSSILAMPYAMLVGALPASKMGLYMGIFNFFIVIPQILAATVLGLLVRTVFGGEAIYAVVTGGVLLFLAGLITLRVDDRDAEG